MIRRPRRSSNNADLHGDRNHPSYNDAFIPQTNSYPFHMDTMTLIQQQSHVRRKKQQRYTILKGIQSYFLRRDGLGSFALIALNLVLLCFWMTHSTLHQMMTRPSNFATTKMRATSNRRVLHRPEIISSTNSPDFQMLYPPMLVGDVKRTVAIPSKFLAVDKRPDFGGIELRIAEDIRFRSKERTIYHDYRADEGYTEMLMEQDDDEVIESYYAFDDDAKRNPYVEYDDPDIHVRKKCRRTSWHRDLPISCNSLHEFDFRNSVGIGHTKFLSNGAYREVYLTNGHTVNSEEKFVLKMFALESDFGYDDYEFARMDAIVNEKLDGNSRIVSMYSYCGISIVSEAMMQGDLENVAIPTGVGRPVNKPHDGQQLTVRNTLSGTQKLILSLEMAEAVLLLHTFPGGVIVHDDIQLSQFLVSSSGQLKLNDFNRAEIMLWNDKDQEYCKYRNHPGGGDWRSPEEYLDRPLDEKIDIWSLGNNIYALLTGMYPFYDSVEQAVPRKVIEGLTGFIDPRYTNRSFAEAKLAEIIPRCWIYDAKQRIDIIHLVNFLRLAVQENGESTR